MKAKLIKIVGGIALGVALLVLALPTIVHKAGLHPEYNGEAVQLPAGKRALIIATNQAVLSAPGETTGDATGVMASEMTHPYYRFLDAGMQVDLASIKGGKIPVDPQTINRLLKTPEDDRFLADPAFLAKVENSMRIDDVNFNQYDIIFMAGGLELPTTSAIHQYWPRRLLKLTTPATNRLLVAFATAYWASLMQKTVTVSH